MADAGAGRIFMIPAGEPFMTVLAQALLDGTLPRAPNANDDPLALADTVLLLPTRGSVTALQAAFLKAGRGRALLPQIKPLADDASDLDVLTSAGELAQSAGLGSRRVIGRLERQLVLASLVERWARSGGGGFGEVTPAQAAHLAKELALLVDLLETHGLTASALDTLVPEDLSAHWQQTLQFLKIVTEYWPQHLEEAKVLSPVAHRERLLRAEIARLGGAVQSPVIMAGVTSLDPVALDLAKAVLACPMGAIVLPGLDQDADATTWDAIVPGHPEHPQYGTARLLASLGRTRADVRVLGRARRTATAAARARLASEAMRPAETTEHWHTFVAQARAGNLGATLSGLVTVDAASAEEEAETIALILREAVETPERTAALVTPDRPLARRVSMRLKAWGLQVPVSMGTPFTQTPAGTFLDLVVEAVADGCKPASVTALLKHPLLRAGLPEQEVRAGLRTLELAVFRMPYFGEGLEGIRIALERAQARVGDGKREHASVRRLSLSDWEAARALVDAMARAMRPLVDLFADEAGQHPLAALVRAHTNAALELAPAEGLYHGPAGEWVAKFFASLLDETLLAPTLTAAGYPDLYRTLVAEKSIRIEGPGHPRIRILDPFEARLQQPDLVVLGGLNEATWPAGSEPGPWLSRPMRAQLGLPAPEAQIGEAAHDFATLLCAPAVVLTRAEKVDGAPTVPSRWLLRLNALREAIGAEAPPGPWLHWARQRNVIAQARTPAAPPMPRPALHLRPRQLSVTAIETWFANPYALYARRILQLEALGALGRPPDQALRGEIVHDALGRFAKAHPHTLPADIAAVLTGFAQKTLEEMTGSPRVAAFWVPRFRRFATWFAETEPARRAGVARVLAEIDGKQVLDANRGPFTLTARADRIDVCEEAGKLRIAITDYKSAAAISDLAAKARTGEAPQLPLEAAIALAGGFAGVGTDRSPPLVETLRYISASGGEPAGEQVNVRADNPSLLARTVVEGLVGLINRYDNAETPYTAVRRPRFKYDYDDYAHLARVQEWSGGDAEEE